MQYNNPTLFDSCSRSRTRRCEELGFPLRVDDGTIDVDEARGGVDKPCYTLEEEACTREAPHKPTKHAQEQEGERNKKS